MNVYLTSDHHFFHRNVILYCKRPFASAEEFEKRVILDESVHRMNEAMVERWNAVVKPGDTVKYLGDFSLSFRAAEVFVKRLNGNIDLIAGNHDKCHPVNYKKNAEKGQRLRKQYYEYGFRTIETEGEIEIAGIKCKMHHMPYLPEKPPEGYDLRYPQYRPKDQGQWLLHGHVHERWKVYGRQINVGADIWDYAPVHVDQIAEILKKGPHMDGVKLT